LAGTVLAGVLPAKAGFARLITVSLLVIALLDTAIGLARTPVLFAIAFVIIQTSLVFAVPRIISYLAILDSTGRSAGMSPASILIGAALGPILGSFIGAPSVMEWVPYTASASTLIAMVLFFVIPVVRKRYQRE
jgi:predicted MFS family arabinose efflux permease